MGMVVRNSQVCVNKGCVVLLENEIVKPDEFLQIKV